MDNKILKDIEELRSKGAKGLKPAAGIIVVIVVIVLFMMLNPFVTIGAGERGVVLNFGAVQDEVLGEGLHFRIPIMQEIIKVDVKIQKSQTDAVAASADIQETHSTIALNYHIDPERANKVYQTIGIQFKSRIIDPAVQEVVKAVTAKYSAVNLITDRESVRNDIRQELKSRLDVYGIVVVDFAIVDFSFGTQFSQAIEAKQTAEQLALKAERDLDRIKIEAQQKVTTARAEAESLRLQKENVSADLIKLRQIEATMKAIEKWDGVMPKVTAGTLPFVDVKNYD